MLPEVGATELIVVAAVALIFVGPKDLPLMLRKIGQFMSRMRAMANEFRASFEDMARQSELDELRREVEAMRSGRYLDPVREAVADARDVEAEQVFDDIHHELMNAPHDPPPEPEPAALPKPRRRNPPKKKATIAAKKPGARKKPGTKA